MPKDVDSSNFDGFTMTVLVLAFPPPPRLIRASAEASRHLKLPMYGFQVASSRLYVSSCLLQLTAGSLEKIQGLLFVY
jgi:hypothetical protein